MQIYSGSRDYDVSHSTGNLLVGGSLSCLAPPTYRPPSFVRQISTPATRSSNASFTTPATLTSSALAHSNSSVRLQPRISEIDIDTPSIGASSTTSKYSATNCTDVELDPRSAREFATKFNGQPPLRSSHFRGSSSFSTDISSVGAFDYPPSSLAPPPPPTPPPPPPPSLQSLLSSSRLRRSATAEAAFSSPPGGKPLVDPPLTPIVHSPVTPPPSPPPPPISPPINDISPPPSSSSSISHSTSSDKFRSIGNNIDQDYSGRGRISSVFVDDYNLLRRRYSLTDCHNDPGGYCTTTTTTTATTAATTTTTTTSTAASTTTAADLAVISSSRHLKHQPSNGLGDGVEKHISLYRDKAKAAFKGNENCKSNDPILANNGVEATRGSRASIPPSPGTDQPGRRLSAFSQYPGAGDSSFSRRLGLYGYTARSTSTLPSPQRRRNHADTPATPVRRSDSVMPQHTPPRVLQVSVMLV